MLKLFKNLRKIDCFLIVFSVGLIIAQVWLDLEIPGLTKEITTLVLAGSAQSQIWIVGIKMLACAFGSAILSAIVGFFAARMSSSFGSTLRLKMFDKVESFSMQEIQKFSTASLITRSTNDVNQVQMTVAMGLQVMIKAPIMAIWAIVEILGKSWQWSIATAGAVFALIILILIITIFAIPRFKIIQKQTDEINRVTRENITGTRVVRAYNAENYEEKKFEVVNNNLTKTQLFVSKVMALISPGMQLIMNCLSLAIYWIGIVLINNAGMLEKAGLFSDMIAFSQYAMRVVMAFIMLAVIFIIIPRASVSAGRINEVLNSIPNIRDGKGVEKTEAKGRLEFKNVCFKYPDAEEYVLKDISFTANQGETVAFIGSTGSGKSTLINLVPRFYDVTEGQITIDGEDIRDYTLTQLHNKIGYISQKAVIFSGTIKSNLQFGECDNELNDLENALKIAQAKDFVDSVEGGMEYKTTQSGTNLSGGQKQRLAIARAIARNPEIYIFDDSFSALDFKTDYNLRSALSKSCKDATKLIVAQRIGTIKDADKIVVLDDGKMVGIGTHKQLMETCEVYKEIALSQLNEEEL